MIRLTVSIEGVKELDRTLLASAQGLKSFRVPLSESRDLVSQEANRAFETEGQSLGIRWVPLSPIYASWKEKRFPGKGILERTGRMRGSFVSKVDDFMAEISNTAEYFKYHQSRAPRTKIPRRPMLHLTQNAKQEIVRIFQKYIGSLPGWKRTA